MKNTVIEVLNKEHGAEVVKYFQSLGIHTVGYHGTQTKSNNDEARYYGVINRHFHNYNIKTVIEHKAEIIELPMQIPELSDGILMLVSNNQLIWNERFIIGQKNGKFIAWNKIKNNELTYWNYSKPIESKIFVELTLQDISNGKGVGVSPEFIKIKR